jgi:hypothetical protein
MSGPGVKLVAAIVALAAGAAAWIVVAMLIRATV